MIKFPRAAAATGLRRRAVTIFGVLLLIGLVGCLEGMKVEGSAESLGKHVTSAVVKAIFLVIILDAIFAMFLSGIGV